VSTLHRALIRAYAAGTHKADVQLVDSLPTLIAGVPVATDIPAAEVVAGRECAVLFFTADNPDDGVVVTVHGAVPAASPGGSKIQDADGDTSVDTEASANENKVRIKVNATERGLFQTASPHVTLTGDTRVMAGTLTVQTAGIAQQALYVKPTATDDIIAVCADINLASSNPGAGNAWGVAGQVKGPTATTLHGLHFAAGFTSGGGTEAIAIWVRNFWLASSTFTVTRIVGLQIDPVQKSGTGTGTDAYGIWVKFTGAANFTNTYGLRISDLTSGTNRYLLLCDGQTGGGGLPNLQLDAQNPPNAALAAQGDSPLWLIWMENGVLSLRRCRTKTFATLAAGDKVMIAV